MILVFALLLLIVNTIGQTCTLEDNTDYDSGYAVMLYGIKSAADCCSACATFDDCTYFSYIKDPNAGVWYQRCFVKTVGGNKKVDASTVAGPVNRPPPPTPPMCQMENNTDFNNGWLSLLEKVPDPGTCCAACTDYPGCNYWSWISDPKAGAWYQRCFFKSTNAPKVANAGTIAGSIGSRPPLPPARTGKRGLAWFNSKSCSDLKLMKGVSWIYNWAPLPDEEIMPCLQQLGIEFIPMQWGGGGIDDLAQVIYAGSSHLLAFNEPNFHSQSNILPAAAAKLWPQLEAIANKHNLKLSSPAASACGPNPTTECYGGTWSPIPYFDAFFGNCTGCKVDFIATHIYTCDITELKTYLAGLKKYNKPIWLSEFACPAAGKPDSFEMDFLKQALQLLDSDPQIERYAWFGTRLDPTDGWLGPQVDLLSDTSCALTPLGTYYNQ
jgi:hypothetical protein